MRGIRLYAIVAVAFMTGAFIASPELRAYAANTVGSADIINNSIQSVDIKDGEVKTADIATGAVAAGRIADGAVGTLKLADNSIAAVDIAPDAVGASELQGVSKLIFVECTVTGPSISAGGIIGRICPVQGAVPGDGVLGTLNTGTLCFKLELANSFTTNSVNVNFRNDCQAASTLGTVKVSIIVFDQ